MLYVEEQPIVDIRYKLQQLAELNTPAPAAWRVLLGFNDGNSIFIFEGNVEGVIIPQQNVPKDAFGFDFHFYIPEEGKSLYELKKEGRKKEHSARFKAIQSMLSNQYIKVKSLSEIEAWTGKYQE